MPEIGGVLDGESEPCAGPLSVASFMHTNLLLGDLGCKSEIV